MTLPAFAPSLKSTIQKLGVFGFTIQTTGMGYKVFHDCKESNNFPTAVLCMLGVSCLACGRSQGMEITSRFLKMYPGFTTVNDASQRRLRRRRHPCPVIRGKFPTCVRGESNSQRKADDERDSPGVQQDR